MIAHLLWSQMHLTTHFTWLRSTNTVGPICSTHQNIPTQQAIAIILFLGKACIGYYKIKVLDCRGQLAQKNIIQSLNIEDSYHEAKYNLVETQRIASLKIFYTARTQGIATLMQKKFQLRCRGQLVLIYYIKLEHRGQLPRCKIYFSWDVGDSQFQNIIYSGSKKCSNVYLFLKDQIGAIF